LGRAVLLSLPASIDIVEAHGLTIAGFTVGKTVTFR
jgi:hypothetical protein